MIELIVLIVFICSFGGALFILARKIPALNLTPYTGTHEIKKHHIILNLENKLKEILVSFEKQIVLHKLLSLVKVMTLKIETRIDVHLHKIRNKAQQISKEAKDKKKNLPE